MKRCERCGCENDDEASRCSECGTEFAAGAASGGTADVPEGIEPIEMAFEFKPLTAGDMNLNLVTLLNCRTLMEADMIVSQLESAGIEAFIPDQSLMSTIGFNLNTYGYVRVQVSPQEYQAAKEFLLGEPGAEG